MATVFETRLRESLAEFYDIYNNELTTSVFSGAFMEVPADEGFFKPNAIVLPGEAVEFQGTVPMNTPQSAAQLYETLVFVYGAWIDRNLLQKTDVMSRGAVSRILRQIAQKQISHLDKKLTTLLLTGETAGNITDKTVAFFSATSALPGGSTIDNLVGTAVSNDAGEIRSAVHAARAKFLSMRGAGNQLINGGWPRIGMMYDPRATNTNLIHESVMDALFPDEAPSVQKIPEGSVVPMPNAYLSGSIDDVWFFDLDVAEKALIVGWQQRPVLDATDAGSDSYVVNRRQTFVSSWAYETSFGNNAAGILGNDA